MGGQNTVLVTHIAPMEPDSRSALGARNYPPPITRKAAFRPLGLDQLLPEQLVRLVQVVVIVEVRDRQIDHIVLLKV